MLCALCSVLCWYQALVQEHSFESCFASHTRIPTSDTFLTVPTGTCTFACNITLNLKKTKLIIFMIFRSRTKLTRLQNRLLLPMSILDVSSSVAQALSTLPKDSAVIRHPCFADLSIGNHASCTMQGIFAQLGLSAPGYNAALCFYYAMVIKYEKRDEEVDRYEKYFHAVALVPNFIVAIVALCNDLYGDVGGMCFLTDYSAESEEIQNKKRIFILVIAGIGLFFLAIYVTIIIWSMMAVYSTVRNQEVRMSTYRFERPGAPRRKSNLAATTADTRIQAYLYVLSFFITYIFSVSLYIIFEIFRGDVPFSISILQATFGPLQGFWNFLIYIRPRFNIITKDHPDKSFVKRLSMTVFSKAGGSGNGNGSGNGSGNGNGNIGLYSIKTASSKAFSTLSNNQKERTTRTKTKEPPLKAGNLVLKKCLQRKYPLAGNRAKNCDSDSHLRHPTPFAEVDIVEDFNEDFGVSSDNDIIISSITNQSNTNANTTEHKSDDTTNGNVDEDIEIGALSMLVAQDFFASDILSSQSNRRRRSMIDLTSTFRDGSRNKWLHDEFNDDNDGIIDINENDDYDGDCGVDGGGGGKSSLFKSPKMTNQQRRRSCPSLALAWNDSTQAEEVFGVARREEEEDEAGSSSAGVLDYFVNSSCSEQLSVESVVEMNDEYP